MDVASAHSGTEVTKRIYHITHGSNLASIAAAGELRSDRATRGDGSCSASVGMGRIKDRRLKSPIPQAPSTTVGEYVPFYFCPRSVMLYLLHRGNHPDLNYRGGQRPIVHLSAEVSVVLKWLTECDRTWFYTPCNASAAYATFHSDSELSEVDWAAVASSDFRNPGVREKKQAEFLIHESVPLELFDTVGVLNAGVGSRVIEALGDEWTNRVCRRPDWYY